VIVSWQPPLFNQGADIIAYRIQLACDPLNTVSGCQPIVPNTVNGLAAISQTARQTEIQGLVSGAKYIITVNAVNSEGTSPDSSIGVQIPGSPPTGLQAPRFLSSSASSIQVTVFSPSILNAALLQQLQIGYAEAGTTIWTYQNVTPATTSDSTQVTISGVVSTKLYVVRMKAKVGSGACDIAGSTCSNWSAWSQMSSAMRTSASCPSNLGRVCSNHGVCDSATASCNCVGNWMGSDCSISVDVGKVCISENKGSVKLWEASSAANSASYTATSAQVGEFLLYRSTDRPWEQINIVRQYVSAAIGTGVGMTGVAFRYMGQTISVTVDPTDKSKCAIVTHNCNYVMPQSTTDYTAFSSGETTVKSFKVTRNCGQPFSDIVISNEMTGTKITCNRWPNPTNSSTAEGFFISCGLQTSRRNCEGIPGYIRYSDQTLASASSTYLIASFTSNDDNACSTSCNAYSSCSLFWFNYEATGANCFLYTESAFASKAAAPFNTVYMKQSNPACHLTRAASTGFLSNYPEECTVNSNKYYVRCCSSSGTGPAYVYFGNTYSYNDAVSTCAFNMKVLCPASAIAATSSLDGSLNYRVWTSSTMTEADSSQCAYAYETGLCGIDGFSLTTASGMTPRSITAVPSASSLFTNPDGQACVVTSVPAAHHATMAAHSLVQSASEIAPLANWDPSIPVLRSDIVEPQLILGNSDDDSSLFLLSLAEEPEHADAQSPQEGEVAVPAKMGGRVGVIDQSLRPAGHQPLASRRLTVALERRNAVQSDHESENLPTNGRLERMEPTVSVRKIPRAFATIATTTTARSSPALESVAQSQPLPDYESTTPLTVVEENSEAVPADSMQRIATPDGLHDHVSLQHALMTFVSAHTSGVTSFHHSVSHPALRYQNHPFFDVHQQLLAQLTATANTTATVTTVTTAATSSVCPATCSASLCPIAQTKCSTVSLCKSSCLSDICSGTNADSALTVALQCEDRTLKLTSDAATQQSALESETSSFQATLRGTPLSECPSFVSGTEPWNVAPYDQRVVAWTLNALASVQSEISRATVGNSTLSASRNATFSYLEF